MKNENKQNENDTEKKSSFGRGLKKGVKKVVRGLRIAIPLTIASAGIAFVGVSAGNVIEKSAKISKIEEAIDYSEQVHTYENDEIAMKIVNNALNGYYGIEAKSYLDSLIASREMIKAEKTSKSAYWLGILGGLAVACSAYGFTLLMADINSDEIAEELKEERKRQGMEI